MGKNNKRRIHTIAYSVVAFAILYFAVVRLYLDGQVGLWLLIPAAIISFGPAAILHYYERKARKQKAMERKRFMRFINKGFRVYHFSVYFPQRAGELSILSKRPISRVQMSNILQLDCSEPFKDTHATDCRYITFNRRSIYSFNSATGKIRREKEIYRD